MKFLIVARQQIRHAAAGAAVAKVDERQIVFRPAATKTFRGLRPRTFPIDRARNPGQKNLFAQTPASQTTQPSQQQKTEVNSVQPRPAAPDVTPPQPPSSPAPIADTNRSPNDAKVSWDNRGLEIEASNSSLNQILLQVAGDTGAKLEGLKQDQRVFGNYGPGPASEVLWKLLDGSGYNVLMIGGPGTDTPLEIVLSVRSSTSPQAVNNHHRSEPPAPEPPAQLPSRAVGSPAGSKSLRQWRAPARPTSVHAGNPAASAEDRPAAATTTAG